MLRRLPAGFFFAVMSSWKLIVGDTASLAHSGGLMRLRPLTFGSFVRDDRNHALFVDNHRNADFSAILPRTRILQPDDAVHLLTIPQVADPLKIEEARHHAARANDSFRNGF